MIILTVILVAVILILLFVLRNKIKQTEDYEDYAEELEKIIIQQRELAGATFERLRLIDIRGAFESDDEVGEVFKGIKSIVDNFNTFLQSYDVDVDEES